MSWRAAAAITFGLVHASVLQAQVPAGDEFVVTTNGAAPALATDAAGNFVLTYVIGDGLQLDVGARRYAASGEPLGPEFLVNTYTAACQGTAYGQVVASDPAGNFTVVWESFGCYGQPAQEVDGGIYAQRFDTAGRPRGAEFRVHTYVTGQQSHPGVATDASGNTVIVWSSNGQGGPGHGVYGQLYDASGQPRGSEFLVAAQGAMIARATVASSPAGDFVVVWSDPNSARVLGRRFAPSGAPQGTEFTVSTSTTASPGPPSVAIDGQGGFVVAWATYCATGCHEARARRFDAEGAPQSGELVVAGERAYGQPALAIDASGGFVVAWVRSGDAPEEHYVRARRYEATGLPRGDEFSVSLRNTIRPTASLDPNGNLIVASTQILWIVAQRFGGIVPAPSLVDAIPSAGSDGNGVLEAGESVQVMPFWRNVNGEAQTFDGNALALSGPPAPGVSYELHDDAGAYGTVLNGSTMPCSDCYQVGVAGGGVRPALHWDAQFTERLIPDLLGQTRIWPLHVGGSFSDVPRTSAYYRSVETVLHNGITGGCRAQEYCPQDDVTREQMAIFTLVGRHGSSFLPVACSTPIFGDVPASSPFCRYVEELARGGVSAGCGGGNFCPAQPVTREQMAVFVLKTLDPAIDPPACAAPNIFNDVLEGSPFCRWIEELARRGVVSGCGGGNYCAGSPTTREQMAVIVAQAYGLKLY